MKLRITPRWALVPVAAVIGCSGTVVVADRVGRVASRVLSPDAGTRFDAAMSAEYRAGFVYAIAAILWVVAGALAAPRHRVAVSLLLYAAGAWLAWKGLGSWYFPEHHPRAYQPSSVPLTLTLAGGLAGVLIIATTRLRTPRQPALPAE